MTAFAMPVYMLEYTPRTISSLLSPAAIDGQTVEIDVYDRSNLEIKLSATGKRVKDDLEMFCVTTVREGITDEYNWNFTILRESADRSRKKR